MIIAYRDIAVVVLVFKELSTYLANDVTGHRRIIRRRQNLGKISNFNMQHIAIVSTQNIDIQPAVVLVSDAVSCHSISVLGVRRWDSHRSAL